MDYYGSRQQSNWNVSPVSRRSRASKAGKRPTGSEPVSKGNAKVRSARDPERELHGDATSAGFSNSSLDASLWVKLLVESSRLQSNQHIRTT